MGCFGTRTLERSASFTNATAVDSALLNLRSKKKRFVWHCCLHQTSHLNYMAVFEWTKRPHIKRQGARQLGARWRVRGFDPLSPRLASFGIRGKTDLNGNAPTPPRV